MSRVRFPSPAPMKSGVCRIFSAKFMSQHVVNVLIVFQRLTMTRGNSVRHECDKERYLQTSYPGRSTRDQERGRAKVVASAVRLGRAVDVPTPVNQFIYHSVLPQELQARRQLVFPQ